MRKRINPKKVALFRNRLKQGGLAAVGCLAVLGSTFIRASVNRGDTLDAAKALQYSLALSAGAGVTWSLFPRAEEPVSQSWDAIKTEVGAITRMAANQALPAPAAMAAATSSTDRSSLYEQYPSHGYRSRRESPGTSLTITKPPVEREFSLDDSMYDPDRRR